MATYTVSVKRSCTGNVHVALAIKRNGVEIKEMVFLRDDLLNSPLEWEEVIPFLIRQAIKQSGATTLAQAKAAVEAAQWVF